MTNRKIPPPPADLQRTPCACCGGVDGGPLSSLHRCERCSRPRTYAKATLRTTRPEHTVACTDALIDRVLSEVRTARDIRAASSALREAAEQREDLGLLGSPKYRDAYEIARIVASGTPARIRAALRAIRATLDHATPDHIAGGTDGARTSISAYRAARVAVTFSHTTGEIVGVETLTRAVMTRLGMQS